MGMSILIFCLSYGAMTAGHCNPRIVEALRKQLEDSTLLGVPSPRVGDLAKEIMRRFPCVEVLRFTNSGTEATMHVIRLARAVTRRNMIVKMEGAYHGAHDYLLISDKPGRMVLMGSVRNPATTADSLGIPEEVVKLTLVVHFNDADCLERAL